MSKDIEFIISPRSIAVVGAMNSPGSVGLATFKNLLQESYEGVLSPVNPKSRSIHGVRSSPRLEVENGNKAMSTQKASQILP